MTKANGLNIQQLGIVTHNSNGTFSGSSVTNHGIVLGSTSNTVNSLGVATNGQLPIGSVGANPVLATLTAGAGISVTNGAGSITIANTQTPAAFQVAQQIFLDDGSYTPTSGAQFLYVEVIGGGGGGGAAQNTTGLQSSVGCGGGSADYRCQLFAIGDILTPVPVVVGDAGVGGIGLTAPTDGGPSSFGIYIASYGGEGATTSAANTNNTAVQGAGTTLGGSGGTFIVHGQQGGSALSYVILQGATTFTMGLSGAGGSTPLGAGGSPATSVNTGGPDIQVGNIGTGYGSGGGGASKSGNITNVSQPGGNGGSGLIRITEYIFT